MPIWIDINPHTGIPIYLQIMEQIKHALIVGSLRGGDQLPTVRQLATELTIAPNTIVRAYNELQRMGIVESKAGVGTVIANNFVNKIKEEQMSALLQRLHSLIVDAAGIGISESDLRKNFEEKLLSVYRNSPAILEDNPSN